MRREATKKTNHYHKGFPKEDAHDMALVTVLDYLNAGVKLLKKDNTTSNFKELSIEYTYDNNGKLLDIKIKKCN